jgi:putative tryptophan/tyrosine transport system substrate-binding protein
MSAKLERREFILLLGSAATWPLAARAQQPSLPVVGFISGRSPRDSESLAAAFRRGLTESGFIEGQNVAIEYRGAEYHNERLPAMVADLIRRKVEVIATIGGTPTVLAAKAATATPTSVLAMGSDPITSGVVTSLNQPGGNVTGVTFFTAPLGPKRLELLRDLLPKATTIAVLVNPGTAVSTADGANVRAAAQSVGLQTNVLNASAEGHVEDAFTVILERRIDALLVTADPFFISQRDKLVTLATRHAIPVIYFGREFVAAGGLMSYGASETDAFRSAGVYVGRILKGARPADLPVMLPTKFELVINLKAAKALSLTVPLIMQMTADEVIE